MPPRLYRTLYQYCPNQLLKSLIFCKHGCYTSCREVCTNRDVRYVRRTYDSKRSAGCDKKGTWDLRKSRPWDENFALPDCGIRKIPETVDYYLSERLLGGRKREVLWRPRHSLMYAYSTWRKSLVRGRVYRSGRRNHKGSVVVFTREEPWRNDFICDMTSRHYEHTIRQILFRFSLISRPLCPRHLPHFEE